jgi:hypothetical protein
VARLKAAEEAGLAVIRRDANGHMVLAPKDQVAAGGAGSEMGVGAGVVRALRPEQQRALELMVSGTPVADAAKEIGVHRATVYAWLKKDAVFAAAHNQWQEQLEVETLSRVKMLMRKATDAVEKSLESGDGRLGLRFLEKTGMVKERAVGPTEAEEVEKERKVERKKKEIERRKVEKKIREDEMDPFL